MQTNFTLFSRSADTYPKIAMVNEQVARNIERYPIVAIATIPYKGTPNGVPAGTEYSRLAALEDKLEKELSKLGFFLLGHYSERETYTIAFRGVRNAPAEVTIKTGLLSKAIIKLESRNDANLQWYEHHLKPTDLERAISNNQQLKSVLETHGDIETTPRFVDFTFYTNNAGSRAALVNDLEAVGISITELRNAEDGTYVLEAKKMTTIDDETIGNLCIECERLATKHGVDFDGWACPVMRQ